MAKRALFYEFAGFAALVGLAITRGAATTATIMHMFIFI